MRALLGIVLVFLVVVLVGRGQHASHRPDPRPRTIAASPTRDALRSSHLTAETRYEIGRIKRALADASRQDELRTGVERLAATVRGDEHGIRALLAQWKRRSGSKLGAAIAAALGLVDDPLVGSTAADILATSHDRQQRLAAVDLLDRVDSTDPAVVGRILDVLSTEHDPELLGTAIYGLGTATADPVLRDEVVRTLTDAAKNNDPEVRRRAVVALGDWATGADGVASVAVALEDSSPAVRAGAAYALGHSSEMTPEILEQLARKVADPQEDWTVRTIARRTLERLGQDHEAMRIYDADQLALAKLMPRIGDGNAP